ncbi:MAG TPA: hypothetical protein VKR30_02940 [Candidatus Limnocylindrales bacterium]|nr:hypothetical protein [Candidatus Limnocylindrales bacterium]
MAGVRAVATAMAMSLIVAACAAYAVSSTAGSGAQASRGAAPTSAPSGSPPGLAEQVVNVLLSGNWTGTFRLSGTVSLTRANARPEVQLVRGSFEVVGHDSSSFVEIDTGATSTSTELAIVGPQAWRRDNGGSEYPVRRDACQDFPDMLVHATAMEEEGAAGSHSGVPLSRLLVTEYASVDCSQGYALAVMVTPFPTLIALSIDRTRTIEVNGRAAVEVTALEATWWAPSAAIVPPLGAWQHVNDTIDALEFDLPGAWRAGVQQGGEVIANPQTAAGIRIVTTPAAGRTLGAVVTEVRATLQQLERFALSSSAVSGSGGFPAQVVAYHYVASGHLEFGITAITVHGGLVTQVTWTGPAGHEAADEELFRAIFGTIAFSG